MRNTRPRKVTLLACARRKVKVNGKKLTLAKLAERTGYSEQYLSEIERGTRPGTPLVWECIGQVLNLEPEQARRMAG